ncbi:hypothetical protein F4X10_22570 [Candidatus Poribacteria bacterium]|nr:hypothetical protein [Candidatus Poribacteria bacterium]
MIQEARITFYKYILLTLVVVLSFAVVNTTIAQEVYMQTGFEEFTVGKLPDDWEVAGGQFEVTKDTVKTDKKALAILGGGDGDGLGVPIETENSLISVEFWIYIESGGRSFNLKITSADNIGENTGCTYINWNADMVRLYDGAAWQPIGDFETDTWKYVRVVADVDKSEFDFYVGNNRNDALGAKAEKGLPFRNAALGPVAKWVVFYVWGMTAPGYVDDLLIYEGEDPLDLAVDPNGKLATLWGQVKHGL